MVLEIEVQETFVYTCLHLVAKHIVQFEWLYQEDLASFDP
jgi:hypothetical protein